MDGMMFCSCGINMEGKPLGKCPQWVRNGNTYWCRIGNGTSGGSICTPYYREKMLLESRLEELRVWGTPGVHLDI
jgi:hypothetical protein